MKFYAIESFMKVNGQKYHYCNWRRSQVVKAAVCKIAIVGSTPTDAYESNYELGINKVSS